VNYSGQPCRDHLTLAVPAILVGVLALSLGDGLIKQQATVFSLWQIFVMRSVIATPFLIYFVRIQTCATPIMPEQFGWTMIRSLLLVLMWLFYYLALPHISMPVAAASLYTLPIFITLFAGLLIGERVGWKGWVAVLLGFAGMMLILQPQTNNFSAYALLPVIAAICYALAMITTRSKCQNEKPLVLALWLNLSFIGVGAMAILIIRIWQPALTDIADNPLLLGEWIPMWIDEWRTMAILAIAIILGSVGVAIAYQSGRPSIIASFEFFYLAFALAWGFLLFDEAPEFTSIVGIVLIAGGGMLAVRAK